MGGKVKMEDKIKERKEALNKKGNELLQQRNLISEELLRIQGAIKELDNLNS